MENERDESVEKQWGWGEVDGVYLQAFKYLKS